MPGEKWRRMTLPATLKVDTQQFASIHEPHNGPVPVSGAPESKRAPGRGITKALRSLSSSSLDSDPSSISRSSSSARKLHKTPSASGSMIERLHRRHSKGSYSSPVPPDVPGSPLDQPLQTMEILHHGCLKIDISLLKSRSEYLVLTDQCLVRVSSAEAAKSIFPHIGQAKESANGGSSPNSAIPAKPAMSEIRLEIPLRSIVATFCEEGSSPKFGIEVWWFSAWPKIAYCKAQLFFSLPRERDNWLTAIHRACRARLRTAPIPSIIPENLKNRINHIVASTEPTSADGGFQNLMFPVARRSVGPMYKATGNEETYCVADMSSFYLVLGPCMCYLVEVLRADYTTLPGDLRVKVTAFGTVTLTRFRATVASQEQRFVMGFRSPFGRENRLDLASSHYRRIIEALTKVDRILKPMWPQHLQQTIFDVRGLPPPLQLTSGNDLGGVERSLEAYCAAYNVKVPQWTIEWNVNPQPAFRVLPDRQASYSSLQLLAVFKALRYNSYFKAISFRDVDLSPLTGRKDHTQYGDTVVTTSVSGRRVCEEHSDVLLHATVLVQEIHALMFASETIKSIDFTNTLGLQKQTSQDYHSANHIALQRMSSELIRPILMLMRWGLFHGHSISLARNPLGQVDIDELTNVLMMDHVCLRKLDLARCSLGELGLSKIWAVLPAQADCLESLDLSENAGTIGFDYLLDSLNGLRAIKHLKIAGNTRLPPDVSLFQESSISSWSLVELDLSGIVLNDPTVEVLARYLGSVGSQHLRSICLNRCGLSGSQIASLFRGMGQGRRITVQINANNLDDGIDDLCAAIAYGYGPWSLFIQMVEFCLESSFVNLLRALTVNKTIECLSLAGSSTPDAASEVACTALAEFFSKNDKIRYLDISGYDSKLDEGRLGRGFSSALGGLRTNRRLEHLRVRSQMLNINTGDLAEAISGNNTLQTLDCESNDFNLSNFRHLVKHLEESSSIQYFSAFSDEELERTIKKSIENANSAPAARRSSVFGKLRPERGPSPGFGSSMLIDQLKQEWGAVSGNLRRVLERNRAAYGDRSAGFLQRSDSCSSLEQQGGPTFSVAFGGLALRQYETQRARSLQARKNSSDIEGTDGTNSTGPGNSGVGTVLRTSSTASSNVASTASDESLGTGISTSPELDSPTERDFDPTFPPHQSPEAIYDDFVSVPLGGFEFHSGDPGLTMKSHRRYRSDPVGRIDEESDGNEVDKEITSPLEAWNVQVQVEYAC